MNIKEIGNIIRGRRKELGINQRSLVEMAVVSVHTVSDIESGKANPTIEIVDKLLRVLGLELRIEVRRIDSQTTEAK